VLKKEFLRKKGPPNEKVIELQRGIISQLGIDPEYGCARLNRIGTDFGYVYYVYIYVYICI
jgi:hypothetical protein